MKFIKKEFSQMFIKNNYFILHLHSGLISECGDMLIKQNILKTISQRSMLFKLKTHVSSESVTLVRAKQNIAS